MYMEEILFYFKQRSLRLQSALHFIQYISNVSVIKLLENVVVEDLKAGFKCAGDPCEVDQRYPNFLYFSPTTSDALSKQQSI